MPEKRYFQIITNNGTRGRFAGSTPKQAANKIFTQLVKNINNIDQYEFSIKECTRNSKKRIFYYVGSKSALECPKTVQIRPAHNKDDPIKVVYKYENQVWSMVGYYKRKHLK
jgi:hypothetical protein